MFDREHHQIMAQISRTGTASRLPSLDIERVPCRSVAETGGTLNVLTEMIKAIFFDAVGTLFQLNGTVGHHYALVANQVGLTLDGHQLDDAFYSAWKKMPQRPAIDGP